MEVHFPADVEKKLHELAAERGQTADQLVQDAVADLFDYIDTDEVDMDGVDVDDVEIDGVEVDETRAMLDRRYDDIESGRVKMLDGEEVFARLREKLEARRQAGS